MRVQINAHDHTILVAISGSLDLFSAALLERELCTLLARGQTEFLFDLSQLDFIDVTGLRVLAGTRIQARAYGGDAVLGGVCPTLGAALDRLRIDHTFERYSTVDAARARATPARAA